MFRWLFELTHSPEEICKKYGHVEEEWRSTSGNGTHWKCSRCGYYGHTPEWS